MTDDKRFVGTFHNEEELYAKIQELKESGTPDDNIYVIAKDDDAVSMVRSRTDAEVKTTDESWVDKFMNFMTGEDHVHHLFDDLGLTEEEKERYTRDIHNGGMVLYVDEGEAGTLYRDNADRYGAGAGPAPDPNLGANALTPDERAAALPPETGVMSDPGITDTAMTDPAMTDRSMADSAMDGRERRSSLNGTAMDETAATSPSPTPMETDNRTADGDFRADTGSRSSGMSATDVNNEAHLHGNYDHTADGHANAVHTEPVRDGNGQYSRTTEEAPETMDLHEERLEVEKQQVQKGEVELDKNVTERQVSTDIPVQHEEVTIERRPVDSERFGTDETGTQESASFDDETIRVPVTEEKVEVTKKPVVTEEIVINKKTVTDTERVDETLKREDVEVKRRGETDAVDIDRDVNGSATDGNKKNW